MSIHRQNDHHPTKRRALAVTVWVAAVWLSGQAGAASGDQPIIAAMPEAPVFPGATTRWVGKQLALNGLPMSIRSFSSSASAKDVLEFYRRAWRGEDAARTAAVDYRGFSSVGAEVDGFYYTVQIRDSAMGSEGMLVVSVAPDRAREDRSTQLPVIAGDQLVQKIEAMDLGVYSQTLILRSPSSLDASTSAYQAALLGDGWSPAGVRQARAPGSAALRWFQKGAEQCRIAVIADNSGNGSRILVHWIRDADETE